VVTAAGAEEAEQVVELMLVVPAEEATITISPGHLPLINQAMASSNLMRRPMRKPMRNPMPKPMRRPTHNSMCNSL
jgi:hypothetical protein